MISLKPDLQNINIPNWVRFIAQDADGTWWGYSVEPLQNHNGWYENEVGEHIKLFKAEEQKRWQQCVFSVN